MDLNDIFIASQIAADEVKKSGQSLQCVNIKEINVDETKSDAQKIAGGNSSEN